MPRKQLIVTIGLSAALIIGMGLSCNKPPATPGIPAGPADAYQRATVGFKVFTTASGDVRYVMDWGDGTIDTSSDFNAGETSRVYHRWENTGDYAVRAKAILDEKPELESEFSEAASITILPNNIPATPTMPVFPPIAVIDVPAFFGGLTTDPDGDSVAYRFEYNGDVEDWTAYVASGDIGYDTITFGSIETVAVRCQAKDDKDSESDWSEPETLIVGTAGAVKWWWWADDEDQEGPIISPVMQTYDGEELIYTSAYYPNKVYGIRATDGRVRESGNPVAAAEENAFASHPAYSAQTGHLYVGNEDGELYAMSLSVSDDWHYPGHTHEDSLTYVEWGAPAVTGNLVYVPRQDDSLYRIQDNGSEATLLSAYFIRGIGEAPVIDAQGNVYVTNDSGYLYKMLPDLTSPVWVSLLSPGVELFIPAIDASGAVYVGSQDGKLFKVNPADGQPYWETQLYSGEVYHYALGFSAIYVTTGLGVLISVDPTSGGINWFTQLSLAEIVAHPILANAPADVGDAIIYVQDIDDVLYCVKQSDGSVVWSCNCLDYGPEARSGGSRRKFFTSEGSLAITSTGDVIVVGEEALYCVAGYPDGLLQGSSWPKWQQNSDNTGKATSW